jgi:hypothetical protein
MLGGGLIWFTQSRKAAKALALLQTSARSALHRTKVMKACGAVEDDRTAFAALREPECLHILPSRMKKA